MSPDAKALCPKCHAQELSKWCPDLRAVRLHSSDPSEVKRLKQTKLSDPSTFDIAVTTYEMAVAKDMSGALTAIHWRVLILDEGAPTRLPTARNNYPMPMT